MEEYFAWMVDISGFWLEEGLLVREEGLLGREEGLRVRKEGLLRRKEGLDVR